MSPEAVERAVDSWFAALNSMNVEQYLTVCAEDAVLHDPVGSPPLENTDARRAFFNGITSHFQTVALTPKHTYVVQNQAAVQWDAVCTTTGGKAVEFGGIDILTFNDEGKVTVQMSYWDPSTLMTQVEG